MTPCRTRWPEDGRRPVVAQRARMASRLTKAWTAPERPKPRMSGHRVTQNMKKASRSDPPPRRTTTLATARSAARAQERTSRAMAADASFSFSVGLVATLAHGVGHAMGEMVIEQFEGDRLQRLGGGGDLFEDLMQ